ncbi:MAG: hypothetical protein F6K19_47150 [Cyanothece sp. SIO1E1]|nr:hypothetical protein [Cyanothece sp. SIO1E1]
MVLELSPEEYSYELLSQYLKSEGEGSWGKQSAYSVAWQYLIYNLIFQKVVENKRGLAVGSAKDIYIYVRENFDTRELNPIGILVSYLKKLERVKLDSQEGLIRAKELQSLYSLEEIKKLIPSLRRVLSKVRMKVLIDELDKGWDNSEDAKYFVAGLFQATQKINLISPNLKVYVSIRQELFDNIPQIYEDAQKIREDVEVIRWGKSELLALIGLRITHSFPETSDLSAVRRWNTVFVGNLASQNEPSIDYIINRTQLRPRELLQFCKLCVEYQSNHQKINDVAVKSAEILYSEQRTKDLASEYRFQYPNLLDFLEVFRGRQCAFSKDDLDYLLLSIACGELDVEKAAEWAVDMDYLELKKILWQIGFLKAWIPGGTNGNSGAKGAYLGHYEIPTINLENVQKFRVHPAFATFLNLQD